MADAGATSAGLLMALMDYTMNDGQADLDEIFGVIGVPQDVKRKNAESLAVVDLPVSREEQVARKNRADADASGGVDFSCRKTWSRFMLRLASSR